MLDGRVNNFLLGFPHCSEKFRDVEIIIIFFEQSARRAVDMKNCLDNSLDLLFCIGWGYVIHDEFIYFFHFLYSFNRAAVARSRVFI